LGKGWNIDQYGLAPAGGWNIDQNVPIVTNKYAGGLEMLCPGGAFLKLGPKIPSIGLSRDLGKGSNRTPSEGASRRG
jgi:hypothetical protein